MAESRNFGVVADAKKIPIIDHVAGVVHAKDVIEHFTDKDLASFASEVKRVLIKGGKLVVTEKNYYTNFPFFDKPDVQVSVSGRKWTEKMLSGESYSQTVSRLKKKYGKNKEGEDMEVLVGLPRIPRSKDRIVQQMKELGFTCDNSVVWRPKRNEPDWFRSHLPRNVMSFSLEGNAEVLLDELAKQEKILLTSFEDPRNCHSLEDLISRNVGDEVQKLRRIDWVPRKMDIARMTSVIKLVQEQKKDGNPQNCGYRRFKWFLR